MMDYDLFKKEGEVISKAQSCLLEGTEASDIRDQFEILIEEYKKLSKISKRLIKLSDRNEKDLLQANHEIASQKEQLLQTQSELVQAEKLASLGQLVAGVAHEINTPVGIMLTSSSALKKETDHLKNLMNTGSAKKSNLREYMEVAEEVAVLIEHHCRATSDLISSFKEVSVDRNLDDCREFELSDYIDAILRSLKPSLASKKVSVVFNAIDPITMRSYPGALNQVLTNLILNSYKHGLENGTREGVICIEVQDHEERISLSISDNGCGISSEYIDRIFDPFVTSARNTGGTGLGLNIVFNLVTGKLGGKIDVESSGGDQGCKFIIELPKHI